MRTIHVVRLIDANANLYSYAAPEHWNDPDMWMQMDLGSFSDSYTASSVPSHGVIMLTLTSTP